MTENENVELSALRDELCAKKRIDLLTQAESPCTEPAVFRCHKCGEFYCVDHASELDPKHQCLACCHVELREEPLVNEEGVRQPGRLLRPVGGAFTEMNHLIEEMSDEELQAYITMYTVLVREAEQLKTTREIALAHAKHQAFDRGIAKLQKLSGEVVFLPAKAAKPKVVRKAKTPVDPIEALKASGLSPEQIAALIQATIAAKAKKGA